MGSSKSSRRSLFFRVVICHLRCVFVVRACVILLLECLVWEAGFLVGMIYYVGNSASPCRWGSSWKYRLNHISLSRAIA